MPPVTDTRQRLIDAAGELFWERGYAATGLSDILESAGARGGSLYHFFPTKDDLLLAVIERHARVVETTIENTLAAHQEPRARVLAVVEFYRSFMRRTGCTLGCPLTNLAAEIGDSHPRAAERIGAFNDRLAQRIGEPLAEVLVAGGNAEQTARCILAMIQGATLQARIAKGDGPLDACAGCVRAMLDGAMGVPQVVVRAGAAVPA
ncbi:MAG TPA: TetR/AcrR family transcriptional regulator [Phycisphaerales bacterium]|nr:TetR/AcrR family transcriptional regulator [Phycisphaerales bacterium]